MIALPYALVGSALFKMVIFGVPAWAGEALRVDIFTAGDRPVTSTDHARFRLAAITIYTVDGLDRFESWLSEDLPSDPEAAKAEALSRIRQLDNARLAPAKNAAIGLAKAVQLGLDRYPAIVFDERAVVYGVTDLVDAMDRYEAWQRETAR